MEPDSTLTTVRVLSYHADYRCRHSGACCTSGWPIPLESHDVAALQSALDTSRLIPVSSLVPPIVPGRDGAPSTLSSSTSGACVFHRHGTAGCAIHHALGHAALPLACRQFPRISVIDPRGVSVTLSHYCPTAAALLDFSHPTSPDVAIIENPRSFRADGEYVGLDVRHAMPPLLRPDMLMDWDAWWEWERQSVALLGDARVSIDDALTGLAHIVEHVRVWRPGETPLIDVVRLAFERQRPVASGGISRDVERTLAGVLAAIPDEWRPSTIARDVRTTPDIARRFVVAHAFANWTAHQGRGLRGWWRSVDAARTLLDAGLGVRQADLLLRHLADPRALSDHWSAAESLPL